MDYKEGMEYILIDLYSKEEYYYTEEQLPIANQKAAELLHSKGRHCVLAKIIFHTKQEDKEDLAKKIFQ